MTREETNLRTKQALAASLKKLAGQKPFPKITVNDIVTDCNVNRKTFYYHFEDIYALLKWLLEQETVEMIGQFDLLAEYEEVLDFVFDYMENNEKFLRNIYRSLGQNELKRFFRNDFIRLGRALVEEQANSKGIAVSDDFKAFLSAFYAEAVAGMLSSWLDDSGRMDREKLSLYLSIVTDLAVPDVLKEANRLDA